jgi:3-isopropylmalate/(R)-2-methylmalate dehydratase small subunit
MSTESERKVTEGKGLPLPGDDIDTDRIIPARYLTHITFDELGQYAFQDERFDQAGGPRPHPFNDPRFSGAGILLVSRNFGCGSSREHAPQSLMRWGIRALIGESFAEIFSGNCTAIGVPAVRVTRQAVEKLMGMVGSDPSILIRIDLEGMKIEAAAESFECSMPEGDRRLLLTGQWDTTGILLANLDAIRATAGRIPYLTGFGGKE